MKTPESIRQKPDSRGIASDLLRALALRKSLGSFALGAKLHAAIGARLERKGGD